MSEELRAADIRGCFRAVCDSFRHNSGCIDLRDSGSILFELQGSYWWAGTTIGSTGLRASVSRIKHATWAKKLLGLYNLERLGRPSGISSQLLDVKERIPEEGKSRTAYSGIYPPHLWVLWSLGSPKSINHRKLQKRQAWMVSAHDWWRACR